MKKYRISTLLFLGVLLFFAGSCKKFNEANENPNSAEKVSSNYILTYVLTQTARSYYALGNENSKIAGAMQYTQRGTNEGATEVNFYGWAHESWAGYYDILRNVKIINDNAKTDGNKLFEGISLVMKSFLFGLMSDLYGDIPYSESLSADDGVFFPQYDSQAEVYKGVIEDLKTAASLLGSLDPSRDAIDANADVIFGGDGAKWRRFANGLLLRYSMRLYNKKSEMSALGVDIVQEFNNAAAGALSGIGDEPTVKFLGTTGENSTISGPLNSPNPNFLTKPAATIVRKLSVLKDPRLQRWTNPVQFKWDTHISSATTETVTNIFGDAYTVTVKPAAPADQVDTSMYVGLPVGLVTVDALIYNKGTDNQSYPPERNPYISYLHDRYRLNTDPYVNIKLMTYSEVEFLLAEAATKGEFTVSGTADQHYKNGIRGSMDRFGIIGAAAGFDFDTYYSNPDVDLNDAPDPLERIMEQKWIASWLGIESWFDWRRTGYPDLQTGPVAQFGDKLPLRYMYPSPNLDPSYMVNYESAVSDLEPTSHVPQGQSADHSYSRMWLIQSTGKPW
ncbi:MAG: SusD/RagB family nutrient-binding outer membrane lipoprotein [Chitinophagaceae bacterium]|nr:SusD/RagB family nutrient-binding outer membrane lipoprotein [Chitinophagaceae bacterium]